MGDVATRERPGLCQGHTSVTNGGEIVSPVKVTAHERAVHGRGEKASLGDRPGDLLVPKPNPLASTSQLLSSEFEASLV